MIENIAFFDFYLDNWRKVAIFAATITVWTMGCERHKLHIYDPEMWSPSILRRHKWSAVGLSVRTSLLFLYPNFVCRMAMGTKNAATLIRELRLRCPTERQNTKNLLFDIQLVNDVKLGDSFKIVQQIVHQQ